MTDTPDNPPAFPRTAYPGSTEPNTPYAHHEQEGMTLRDYFAGKALQGMLATGKLPPSQGGSKEETVAQRFAWDAYAVADAMLAARARRQP